MGSVVIRAWVDFNRPAAPHHSRKPRRPFNPYHLKRMKRKIGGVSDLFNLDYTPHDYNAGTHRAYLQDGGTFMIFEIERREEGEGPVSAVRLMLNTETAPQHLGAVTTLLRTNAQRKPRPIQFDIQRHGQNRILVITPLEAPNNPELPRIAHEAVCGLFGLIQVDHQL